MKHWKALCLAALMALSVLPFAACGEGGGELGDGSLTLDENFECTITVDGGGQWANFNTTSSMTESDSNPYPYNTLETLAQEYMDLHPNITIQINRNSLNGARDAILPMLGAKTAPDILFQVPTCLAEDCSQNYYAELDEYLQLPNPYSNEGEPGSEKWFDIYGDENYNPTVDGHYYYVAMDKSAIGIIYNKTFFTQNNLSEPQTYSELLALIERIHEIDPDVVPFSANGGNRWLDITIESAVYAGLMDEIDTNGDGTANAEEIIRAYDAGIYDPSDEYAQEVMRLAAERVKYSPDPQAGALRNDFMLGGIIMGEADGMTISYLMNNVEDFEVGVFPYPEIDTEASEYVTEGVGTRRGSAGLSTAWFVTNSAFKSSDADYNRNKVNACVDFLMFLTAYENNDRMINDKQVSVPLSGNGYGKNDCFKSLMEVYAEECEDPDKLQWGSFSPSGTLTKSFYDASYLAYHDYLYGHSSAANKNNFQAYATAISNAMDQAQNRLSRLNGWSF